MDERAKRMAEGKERAKKQREEEADRLERERIEEEARLERERIEQEEEDRDGAAAYHSPSGSQSIPTPL